MSQRRNYKENFKIYWTNKNKNTSKCIECNKDSAETNL